MASITGHGITYPPAQALPFTAGSSVSSTLLNVNNNDRYADMTGLNRGSASLSSSSTSTSVESNNGGGSASSGSDPNTPVSSSASAAAALNSANYAMAMAFAQQHCYGEHSMYSGKFQRLIIDKNWY